MCPGFSCHPFAMESFNSTSIPVTRDDEIWACRIHFRSFSAWIKVYSYLGRYKVRPTAHFDPGTEASNIIKTVPFWEVSLLTKYLLLRRFTPVEGWYSRVSAGCAGTNCTHYLKNYSDFGEYVTCTRLRKIYGMFLPNEPSRSP